jgi:Asp-tRNA(Asn)/Glu-tRNA(Gln) amidotransferase A subunit family amidase
VAAIPPGIGESETGCCRSLHTELLIRFDVPPALVAADAMTNPIIDLQGLGNNRRLAPILGFPALTVPAGFTSDGLPVGIEFLGRPFSDLLF